MKVILGSDHGGFALKQVIIDYLTTAQIAYVDCGINPNKRSDYPLFGHKVAKMVLADPLTRGIVICGTGIGISIAANRHRGIRCALAWSQKTARLARQHNDANVLALGGRVLSASKALALVKIFLTTSFQGQRHQIRIKAIEEY